jgi:hypothetical protein
MQALSTAERTQRYARCIDISKRVRWDIDQDLIRGRSFDHGRKFLPDRLACMDRFEFATPAEQRLISQVQGRTYANLFALVERFIAAKMLDVGRGHALGDQVAMESLVRLTDEELKHQALFRRLDSMMENGMPAGYTFMPQANDVAGFVLSKSDWAVLALTCHIEMFSIEHYKQSIDPDPECSELWKDVFRLHMREEAQHAVMDEMEWERLDAQLTPEQRDRGVTELIELVAGIDGLLQQQARADADYFLRINDRVLSAPEATRLREGFLGAYRWQYILSGALNERFSQMLRALCSPQQVDRIGMALAPLAEG